MAKVFLDKIKATAHIESVVAKEDLGNDQFLSLGVLGEDGESRVATPATDEASAEVFVADAPLSYGDPHSHGKYIIISNSWKIRLGSPPLAWGIPVYYYDNAGNQGITPTRMGNTGW